MKIREVRSWHELLLTHILRFDYRHLAFEFDIPHYAMGALRPDEHRLVAGVRLFQCREFCAAAQVLASAAEEGGAHQDLVLFYLGQSLQALGRYDQACIVYQDCFREKGRIVPALMEAGRCANQAGHHAVAVEFFSLLQTQGGDRSEYASVLSLDELAVYQRAKARFSPRVEFLLQPCSLLGTPGPRISTLQDRAIGCLFDQTLQDWEQGNIQPPIHANRWQMTHEPTSKLRLLFMFPANVNCSEYFAENNVASNLIRTCRARGHEAQFLRGDKVLYGQNVLSAPRLIDGQVYKPSKQGTSEFIRGLEAQLQEMRPDWLVLDGNFIPDDTTLTVELVQVLKETFKFRLVVVVAEMYDNAPDFAGTWLSIADRVVCLDANSDRFVRYSATGKMFYFPCLPMVAEESGMVKKSIDFCFVGSLTRDRAAFLSAVPAHISNHRIIGSARDLQRTNAPSDWNGYRRLMAQSKLTFNSGFIGQVKKPYIQTARSVEAIVSRTGLLEEGRYSLQDCYVPFIHYVPVSNVSQFVCQMQFLLNHADHLKGMVERAHSWFSLHYSAAHFWTSLEMQIS